MKLFKESELFQKERPLTITNKQFDEILKEVAQDIIKSQCSISPVEKIIMDLDNVYSPELTGYEIAKELEDGFGYYIFNSELIEIIESIDCLVDSKKRENVKLWVKAHNIQPKFKKGDKLKIKLPIFSSLKVGDEIYINYLKEETAQYVIDKDPKRNGGIIADYEKLERSV